MSKYIYLLKYNWYESLKVNRKIQDNLDPELKFCLHVNLAVREYLYLSFQLSFGRRQRRL